MIASCDAQARGEVVENCKDGSLPDERREESLDAAKQRDANNEGDVQPVDVFVPILASDGSLGDVGLSRLVMLVAVRFGLAGHW